jgi:hypothetical protein
MLSGVNEDGMKVSAAPVHRGHERRYLHKVGPRARDVDYLEHGESSCDVIVRTTS